MGIGFETKSLLLSDFISGSSIALYPKKIISLKEVVVKDAGVANQYKQISTIDIKMRGVTNAQEVLRSVPGLFIGQHQGGGKSEQIFIRGFDSDHGTDIRLNVDGIPINMPHMLTDKAMQMPILLLQRL